MFKASRPRTPSKAALRILYQLAYVSSGAAVGVATLCAEESRRRAQILQKIADNGRRLRQSPRHVHNAVAAIGGNSLDHIEQQGPCSAEIKSVQGARKRQDLERLTISLDGISAKAESSCVHSGEVDQQNGCDKMPIEHKSAASCANHMRQDISTTEPKIPSQLDLSLKNLRHDVQMQHTTTTLNCSRARVSNLAKRGNSHKGANNTADLSPVRTSVSRILYNHDDGESVSHGRNHNLRVGDDSARGDSKVITSAAVSRFVEEFFRDPLLNSYSPHSRFQRSSRLLQVALQCGTLSEVRTLCLWRLDNSVLSDDDVSAVCEACKNLSLYSDHKELLDFFDELFTRTRFSEMPVQTRLYCILMVYASNWWGLLEDDRRTQEYRLQQELHFATPLEIKAALSSACEKYLEHERPKDAVSLIPPVQRQLSVLMGEQPDLMELQTKIFSSALSAGQLKCCVRILHLLLKGIPQRTNDDEILGLLRSLLWKANQIGRTRVVCDLLRMQTTRYFLKRNCNRLDGEERKIVALACLSTDQDVQDLWEALYDDTVIPHSDTMAQVRTVVKLRKTWEATNNLKLVNNVFGETMAWAETNRPNDQYLRLAIRLTCVGILNSADMPDLALKRLSEIREDYAHSSYSLVMTAVTQASKGLWDEVHQLVEVLGKWKKLVIDIDVARTLDDLLQLYSAKHTVEETWNFATGLVRTLGFKPSRRTNMIMMSCFIARQQIIMIPRWLRFVKASGSAHPFNPKTAVRLLQEYYLKYRPPRTLLLCFTRQLTYDARSLEPHMFFNVIDEATGYDHRKINFIRENPSIRQRYLSELEKSQAPSPFQSRSANDVLSALIETPPVDLSKQASEKSNSSFRSDARGQSFERSRRHSGDGLHCSDDLGAANLPITSRDCVRAEERIPQPDFQRSSHFSPKANTNSRDIIDDSTESSNCDIPESLFLPPGTESDLVNPMTCIGSKEVSEARSHYIGETLNDGKGAYARFDEKRFERVLVLAFSRKQYQKVLNMYSLGIEACGRPPSRLVLQLAVEACLRLHKRDWHTAEQIIVKAREAGMNVTSAVGHLLMHRIWSFESEDKRNLSKLRTMVMNYYRMIEETGSPMSHHLAVTAANILINNKRPKLGLNLLSSIYKSDKVPDGTLNIAVMTVFVKGFAGIASRAGIEWAVETVLKEDMRIDGRFLDILKSSKKNFSSAQTRPPQMSDQEAAESIDCVKRWCAKCRQRMRRQRVEVEQLGWKLVSLLHTCSDAPSQAVVDSATRIRIETELLGKAERETPFDATPEELEATQRVSEAALGVLDTDTYSKAIAQMRSLLFILPDQEDRSQDARSIDDPEWLDLYRVLLKQNLMIDGRKASFRFQLDIDMEDGVPLRDEQTFEEVIAQAQYGVTGRGNRRNV